MALPPSSAAPVGLAADSRSLDSLRSSAARDPRGAAKAVAKQFEALFMQELMKSMRASTEASGLLDNEGTQLGNELLDKQIATQVSGLPGGLADAIARQIERGMGLSRAQDASGAVAAPLPARAAGAPVRDGNAAAATPGDAVSGNAKAQEFVAANLNAARAAEASTGIPAAFMIAQAAHETGWGRRDIRMADGSASNNLFGIKAGPGWKGAVAEVRTTEYVDGQPRSVVARFRAYASREESFADYARLMKTSPRYAPVLANAGSAQGFAQGLQRAGYATDPAYADKLGRVINTTLRLQRALI
ncbi:flagellar assembly peptidoglycan hydrolase FlgJ [Azohydromonas caseinilytica]|uniref:Peptidoglycan hydrolase FlgJ n=1 Tax=Azohydromonas caseinilytica TaxID=2728836 RepID=A0A848FAA1_9BURK|nr:flagellar assembly peptidoglycan hydrolase FlgJ [Azohydromonas caseinilytica]NML14911.1 flagellar assembly peptidoglycan hydrolase FlgJ [Azohydromonas caseinilytica]